MTLSELEVGEEHLVATLLASLISTGSLWLPKGCGWREREESEEGGEFFGQEKALLCWPFGSFSLSTIPHPRPQELATAFRG